MPTIHIETQPVQANTYELVQTWIDDAGANLDERTYIETHEDRMYAAMTNLGKACRWLSDAKAYRPVVCIVTDTDGKDQRYGGEHDDLYEAVRSSIDYQRNRAKYSLIYGKYVGYLDRIRELADSDEITFTQNADVMLGVMNRGREFVHSNAPIETRPSYWTRDTILKLSMKGARNIVTCRQCQKSIMYLQTDNFAPFTVLNDKRTRTKLITSNKMLVKNFLDAHCVLHGVK